MPKASAGRRIKQAGRRKNDIRREGSGAFHPFRAFPPTHPHELGSAWWDVAVKKSQRVRDFLPRALLALCTRARPCAEPRTMTDPAMAATPMAHRRESPVVGLIFSSLKKRSIHKKRASRPVVCFDQKSPVVSEKAHTDDSLVCSEEASSPPVEATRLHLPSISPAQCHMLHFAHKERPHSPAKLPAGCLPRLQQPSGRHTLLLDLDHTLINTHPSKPTTGVAGIDWLKLELPRHAPTYVSVRPHLAEFVRELQRLPYDLSVFTASSEAVAGPKLDWLETRLRPVDLGGCAAPAHSEHHGGVFSRRFFQEACARLQPSGCQRLLLVKDLRAVLQPGADLARVLLVEDLPVACAWQPSNVCSSRHRRPLPPSTLV